MSSGDSLLVTIKDTPSGLKTEILDQTSGQSGFMVASAANGFAHTAFLTCATSAFDFHPLYDTAKVTNYAAWTSDLANVNLAFEIGHNAGSYQADWPNGSPTFPTSIVIGAPSGNGVGPMSINGASYSNPYPQLQFSTTQSTSKGTFYPFYSQAGNGAACVFNFGNDISGSTVDDFGKTSQYTNFILKLFGLGVIQNPCPPSASFPVSPVPEFTSRGFLMMTAILSSAMLVLSAWFRKKRVTGR
jgi:hypothetical protein